MRPLFLFMGFCSFGFLAPAVQGSPEVHVPLATDPATIASLYHVTGGKSPLMDHLRWVRKEGDGGLVLLTAQEAEDLRQTGIGVTPGHFCRHGVGKVRELTEAELAPYRTLGGVPDPLLLSLASEVDQDRLESTDRSLVGFGTRFSQTYQCNLATAWAQEQFESLGLRTFRQFYTVYDLVYAPNVVAFLPGKVNPDRAVVICGHMDSTSRDARNFAPGADDNGSGSSAILETARIFSEYQPGFRKTVIFILFTGEEQGLWGSREFTRRAHGGRVDIFKVLNFDMIGYTDLDTLPEDLDIVTNPDNVEQAAEFGGFLDTYAGMASNIIADWAETFSDHAAFWDYGWKAVHGIVDNDVRDDPYYHTVNDLPETVDFPFLERVAKAGTAAVASWAEPLPGGLTYSTPVPLTPSAPVINPVDPWAAGEAATVTWLRDLNQALHYQCAIAISADFFTGIWLAPWLDDEKLTFGNLEPGVVYYSRVRARNYRGTEGSWSEAVSWTQAGPPPYVRAAGYGSTRLNARGQDSPLEILALAGDSPSAVSVSLAYQGIPTGMNLENRGGGLFQTSLPAIQPGSLARSLLLEMIIQDAAGQTGTWPRLAVQ